MEKLCKWCLFILFWLVLNTGVNAQTQYWIAGADTFNISRSDSLQVTSQVRQFLVNKIMEGYIYSNLDSIKRTGADEFLYFHFGEKYRWRPKRVIVDSAEIHLRKVRDLDDLLDEYSDSGYPFVSLSLANIEEKKDQVLADIIIDRKVLITYDTIRVAGLSGRLSDRFLWDVFNMVPGEPFREIDYQSMSKKLELFPFLKFTEAPGIGFSNGKAMIHTSIQVQNTNTFEGVIGLLQSRNSKSILTGYLDLELRNLFRSGKRLSFSWNRFQEFSQSLDLDYSHPYFLHSDLTLGFEVSMFKQDTTFLNRNLGISISKNISGGLLMAFRFEQDASTLIETAGNEKYVPFMTNWYGLSVSSQDNFSGISRADEISFGFLSEVGDKKIDDQGAGDSLGAGGVAVRLEGSLFFQKTIGKRASVTGRSIFRYIDNDNLVENELYRLGGLKTFRGFNENEIFAKTMVTEQLEFRQYLEDQSYLLLFFDTGVVHNPFSADKRRIIAGIGGGIALTTKSGFFNFIFANGLAKDQPVSINDTKIHFGFTSYF